MSSSQNRLGNVVLFNRRNNQIQLSTNADRIENGEEPPSPSGRCPTCHRPLEDEVTRHAPAFMDAEYFRLLSESVSELPSAPGSADGDRDPQTGSDRSRAGSLPASAFNQGYFERYCCKRPVLKLDSLSLIQS